MMERRRVEAVAKRKAGMKRGRGRVKRGQKGMRRGQWKEKVRERARVKMREIDRNDGG